MLARLLVVYPGLLVGGALVQRGFAVFLSPRRCESRPSRDYSSRIPDYSSSIPDYSSSVPVYSAVHPNQLLSQPDYSLLCSCDRSCLRRLLRAVARLLVVSLMDSVAYAAVQGASTASNAPSCRVRSPEAPVGSGRCRISRRPIRAGLTRRFSASFARAGATVVARIG
jgi:hypothetical protein